MTDIDVDALEACPFCGGEAERLELTDAGNEGGSVICCKRCQANSHVEFGRKENLVSAWNTRAQSAPAPDDVREVVAKGLYNHEWSRDGNGMEKIWGENTDRLYWLALADAAIAAMRGLT